MDHPSREDLAALGHESLPKEREREAVRHLLFTGCSECLALVPPELGGLLGRARPWRRPTPEEEAAYDGVIARASARPLALARHLREQREAADRGLKLLAAGRKLPRALEPLARMWAYLDRSWQLRYDDPQAMVELASLAVIVAYSHLDLAFYGEPLVHDFQARAAADLGNAHRVASHFQYAGCYLDQARCLFEQGTGDPLLEVRLLDFEASLFADRRDFGPATQKLNQILAFHERRGDRHFVGYSLVRLGLCAGYEGRFDLAIQHLKQSLELIDAERDPTLAFAASHNLVLFLVDSGRIAEAKKLRLVHSRHLTGRGGRVNQLKDRALEGHIAIGEGNYPRAETIFREVGEGMADSGLPIMAGVEMLYLTAALLPQGKAKEAERTAAEASKLFSKLGIQREALQAVILLRDAFRMRTATVAKVLEVADFLRRGVSTPGLRFEARTWDGG